MSASPTTQPTSKKPGVHKGTYFSSGKRCPGTDVIDVMPHDNLFMIEDLYDERRENLGYL